MLNVEFFSSFIYIWDIEDPRISVWFLPYIYTFIYHILKLTRYDLLYFDSQRLINTT
jgi:hypothetical protein